MSRKFQPATVYRNVSKPLLMGFFKAFLPKRLRFDWEGWKKTDLDVLEKAIDELPNDFRKELEWSLEAIHSLSCQRGIEAILEAGSKAKQALLPNHLPAQCGFYEKVMWVWNNHNDVIHTALQLYTIDGLRWWKKCCGLPRNIDRIPKYRIKKLEDALAAFLVDNEGRGRCCTVRPPYRRDHTMYFFAYPDDYPKDVNFHDEKNKLVSRVDQNTFEIVFAYDSREGSLEHHANVAKKLRHPLEAVFAKAILKHDLALPEPRVFRLDHILDPDFRLKTDLVDQIDPSIQRITLVNDQGASISVRCPVSWDGMSINQMVQRYLKLDRLQVDDFRVKSASFRIGFAGIKDKRRLSMTFEVSCPNTCDIRNQPEERIELAYKYLKMWGIYDDSGLPGVPPDFESFAIAN